MLSVVVAFLREAAMIRQPGVSEELPLRRLKLSAEY
jgi:hypothetical protein